MRDSRAAIVRVTLGSICTSDLHIKHGGVPRAVPGITAVSYTHLGTAVNCFIALLNGKIREKIKEETNVVYLDVFDKLLLKDVYKRQVIHSLQRLQVVILLNKPGWLIGILRL